MGSSVVRHLINIDAGLQGENVSELRGEKKGRAFLLSGFSSPSIPGLERYTWVKKHLKRDPSKYRVNMCDAVFPFLNSIEIDLLSLFFQTYGFRVVYKNR